MHFPALKKFNGCYSNNTATLKAPLLRLLIKWFANYGETKRNRHKRINKESYGGPGPFRNLVKGSMYVPRSRRLRIWNDWSRGPQKSREGTKLTGRRWEEVKGRGEWGGEDRKGYIYYNIDWSVNDSLIQHVIKYCIQRCNLELFVEILMSMYCNQTEHLRRPRQLFLAKLVISRLLLNPSNRSN